MNLPDLTILEIVSNFSLKEQFKLREISKKWKSIIELKANNTERLFVYDKIYSNQEKWSSNNKRIKNEEKIDRLSFENFCLINNYFPNIKRLFLFKIDPNKKINDLKSKFINFIENLEELCIELYCYLDENSNVDPEDELIKLLNFDCLSNLKVLSFKDIYNHEDLKINIRKLEKISVGSIPWVYRKKIIISNPESVKVLECTQFDVFNNAFPNLEHLICMDLKSNFVLSNYPKLKRLEFCPSRNQITFLENLLKEKKVQNNELEIIIYGHKLLGLDEKFKQLLKLINIELNMIHIHNGHINRMENYTDYLDAQYFNWKFTYLCDDIYYSKFLLKLNIKTLALGKVKNFDKIIKFLKINNGIYHLEITDSFIDKKTKEQLMSIPYISIFEARFCNLEENYDFIEGIKFLNQFRLSIHDLNLMATIKFINIVKKCKLNTYRFSCKKFYFNFHNGSIRLTIYKGQHNTYEFSNLDELYSWMKSNFENNGLAHRIFISGLGTLFRRPLK